MHLDNFTLLPSHTNFKTGFVTLVVHTLETLSKYFFDIYYIQPKFDIQGYLLVKKYREDKEFIRTLYALQKTVCYTFYKLVFYLQML